MYFKFLSLVVPVACQSSHSVLSPAECWLHLHLLSTFTLFLYYRNFLFFFLNPFSVKPIFDITKSFFFFFFLGNFIATLIFMLERKILRGRSWFLEIVFVGQCEVFVCL